MVKNTREIKGECIHEKRYYISSLECDAKQFVGCRVQVMDDLLRKIGVLKYLHALPLVLWWQALRQGPRKVN